MGVVRIVVPLGLAGVLGLAALAIAPRAFEAQTLIFAQDDPVALADHAISRSFDAAIATREINAALAADDPDLALSFLELARERAIPVDPVLAAQVEAANAREATVSYASASFARGLITGEPQDLSSFAGTAVGDLFVLGDIRDAVREGTRFARGEEVDEL